MSQPGHQTLHLEGEKMLMKARVVMVTPLIGYAPNLELPTASVNSHELAGKLPSDATACGLK